jgi:COP9 signalosome complex subunit 1
MQHNALSVARKYEEEAKERLRRINIVAAGLEIPAPKKSDYQPDVQGDIMLEGETAVS